MSGGLGGPTNATIPIYVPGVSHNYENLMLHNNMVCIMENISQYNMTIIEM